MDKEVFGYIYKIRNTVNEKVYIGLTTVGFNRRYPAKGEGIERVYGYHIHQRKNGEYYNEHLLRSIEKYGLEAFEVIKEFDIAYSEEELKEKEKYWISFYKCNDANYGYNRTGGGDGMCGLSGKDSPGYKGFVVIYPNGEVSKDMTEEETANYLNLNTTTIKDLAREKTCYIGKYERIRYIRVLHLQDYLEEKELYRSNEDFRNMCKHMVEEAKVLYKKKKEEYSETCKNRPKRTGENHHMYGKHRSEETRKKQSEIMKGKYIGENHPMYGNGDKLKGKKNGRAKLVVAIFPDGRVIKDVCMKELTKELGVGEGFVRNALNLHEPYTPNKRDYERLKHLDGVIIMYQEDYQEDYLNTIENTNINDDDKAS